MNIWVCDDQLISARELKKLLETFPDINAKIFTDLSEMINTLDSTDSCPDSLIIDIDFYGKPKGLSAGNIIQKRFPYIPVLFATAYSESYAQLVLLDCPGAFGYLTKPYSVSVLSRYLEKLRAVRGVIKVINLGEIKLTVLVSLSIQTGHLFSFSGVQR